MADHIHRTGARMHDIIGVYGDPEVARGVANRIGDLGVPPSSIRVGSADARVESIKAEMRDEADNTIVGPGNVGPFTKEMTKGIVRHVLVWTLALAALGALLAFIDWPASELDLGTRLIIAVLIGAVTGATIGFVWGGGIGGAHEGSFQSLAAERGVTVSASVPSGLASEAVRVMRDAQPIRLDLGTLEGNPVDTIATEEDIHR